MKSANKGFFVIIILLALILTNAIHSEEIDNYSQNILLKGKWGTAPGEFGYKVWEGEADYPNSFAVDSKENVYILDKYNNRIQMFDSNGSFVKEIPIKAMQISTKEEIEASKKTWNKLGYPFPIEEIDHIDVINDDLLIFGGKRIDSKMKKYALKYKEGRVNEIDENNYVGIESKSPGSRENIVNTLNLKKKFQIDQSEKKYKKILYDNKEIKRIYTDNNSNLYTLGVDRRIRKYDKDEREIFNLNTATGNLTNPVIISKSGNIYLLKLFSEKYPEKEGYDLSINGYSGIEIIRWEKNKSK